MPNSSKQRFGHCFENGLIKTMQTIPHNRGGAISKLHVSTPKSFAFVLKSTMNTKKWYLKVNNHPLIGFLVL